jgi:GDP-4-dehydro-6-deoxy-D-mannose reductase
MTEKPFITGSCGMMGSHLIDFFHSQNQTVYGTYYKPTTNLAEFAEKAQLEECDVRYYHHLYRILNNLQPNVIYHLAAQSYPTVSVLRPQETFDINVTGTVNLFEAIKEIRKSNPAYDPLVVVACSSAEYGSSLTPENVPIKEDVALLPLHPYGVSKVVQDLLSYQYSISDKLKIIRARIFNTTGPRKVNDVASDFTKRAVLIEKGKETSLKVGNLSAKRAITDVRDLIQALILLSKKGKPGEVYNISGSKVYEMTELIAMIEKIMTRKFKVEVDQTLLRPTDEPIIYGDSTRLAKDTGWSQQFTLEQTLTDMIAYWRERL